MQTLQLLVALEINSIFISLSFMPFQPENLIRANRDQVASEKDSFTIERYRQFAKYLPQTTQRILDIGGGVGEGWGLARSGQMAAMFGEF